MSGISKPLDVLPLVGWMKLAGTRAELTQNVRVHILSAAEVHLVQSCWQMRRVLGGSALLALEPQVPECTLML
eukprot:6482871-Amphidinium_carterae.2